MSLPPGFRPVRYRPQPQRTLLERLNLRFPAAHRISIMLVHRLPPGRLRRLYLERLVFPMGYGAMNRRDFDAFGSLYFTEDLHARYAGAAPPGMRQQFAGREEMQAGYVEWLDGWGDLERVPVAYAEAGDRLVVLTRQQSRGGASGIPIDAEVGQVYRLRGGLVCEYVECRSWDEAIEIGGMGQ